MKRARDGRRRKRKAVDIRFHLFEFFFVLYAEALLFVDYHKAEIFKNDVFLNDAVRADKDVDIARCKERQSLFLFRVRYKAREDCDFDGEIRKAFDAGFVMLFGEDRRRRQKNDLLSAHDRFERGAHRDFGFAVADVSADEAIHRNGFFHIALDFFGDDRLIFRIFIGKGRFERSLPFGIFRKRKTPRRFSPRIEVDELFCQIFDGFLYFALSVFPAFAADFIELRSISFASDIALHHIHLFDRNEGDLFVRILELYIVPFVAAGFYALDTAKDADAVLHVHDIVAGGEFDESVDCGAFRFF